MRISDWSSDVCSSDLFVRRPGRGAKGDAAREAMAAYLAQAPLSAAVRRDVLAIETGDTDYMPGLTSEQKKDKLSRISYRDSLLDGVKADEGVIPYYLHRTAGPRGCGTIGRASGWTRGCTYV